MAWQAIRSFEMGDQRCEVPCGHFHRSPEAAAKCGYGDWLHGGSDQLSFAERVRFVGEASQGHCTGDEMECRRSESGQITIVPRPQPESRDAINGTW